MSEQEKKPTIEDGLRKALSGDLLENALDFVAYLKEIGMTIHPDDPNRFTYMGEYTCILVFFDGMLFICDCPICEYDGLPLDVSLQEFALANIKKCEHHDGCDDKARAATKTIFGKEIDNLCSSEIQFFNLDATGFEKIKKLMDYWKLAIIESKYKGR